MGRYLGRGASATVWEASHGDSGKKVAVKVFDQGNKDKRHYAREAAREARMLSRVRSPYILEFLEIVESGLHVHMVCESIDGETLRTFAQRMPQRRLEHDLARRLYRQVVSGINFCHERLVVHRDVKLENLLLDRSGEKVKIIDFGFAAQVASKDVKLKAFCGTPAYMAPEIVRWEQYSGFATDVWALGVVLFTLLSGYLPFSAATEVQLYARIRRGVFVCPESLGELPKRLVRAALKPEPSSRPGSAALLRHPWLLAGAEPADCRSDPSASSGSTTPGSASFSTWAPSQDSQYSATLEPKASARGERFSARRGSLHSAAAGGC